MTEKRPFVLERQTHNKEKESIITKLQVLRKNKRYTIQTKKNVGGGPRWKRFKKGVKKAFTPSTPSTKAFLNPRRLIAYESTKKKRALQATAKSGIQFAVKHEHYRRGVDLITNYNKAKAEVKILSGDEKKKKSAEIAELKKELKNIGVNSGNIEKALTQFTKKRDSYDSKLKESTTTADTLKKESVNFIKGKSDYIKKGQPELKNKLGALVSTDHTKMAMIKVPGVGNTPVSKLKYSDFTDPKVTEAYLDQFKTVNASISKINKNFNINLLSENGKIELAKELHKITKDGIVDPTKQEEHFLKAVTDITYKDKVYSALDSSSKSAAKRYIAENPVKVYEDTPEPTLRQRRDEITKKLQNPDLTDEEKIHFEAELKYLNTELVVEPNDIQKQIDEARGRMTGETDYEKRNKIQDEITRLEARKEEIEKRNADDNIEAEKAIQEEIGKLKESTVRPEGLGEGITRDTIKEDLDTLEQKEKRLQEEYERKTETTEEDLQEFEKGLEPIKNQRQALRRKLKAYEAYEKNQALIGQLTSMTPENRAKLEEELKGKDVNELKDILSAEQQKAAQFSNNPAIQRIIQRNVDNIQKTINTKNLLQSVAANTDLKPTQREYIQTQITSGMTADNVVELKGKVMEDKELNYRLQKQELTRLKEEAEREKAEAKGRLVAARADVQTKGFLTRFGRKFKNAPDVKAAKRAIKEQRAQSAFLGRAEKAWKPGTESYTRGRYRPFTKTRKVSANNLQKRLGAQQEQRRKNENERQRLKMLEELKKKFPIKSNAELGKFTQYMKSKGTPSRPGLTEGTFVDPNATPKIKIEPDVPVKEEGPSRGLEFVKKSRNPYTPEQREAFKVRRAAAREAEATALKDLDPLNTMLNVEYRAKAPNAPVKKGAEPTVVNVKPNVVKAEQTVVKGAAPNVVKADPTVVNVKPNVVKGADLNVVKADTTVKAEPNVVKGSVVKAEQTVVNVKPTVVKADLNVVKGTVPTVESPNPTVVNQPEQEKNKPRRNWSLLKKSKSKSKNTPPLTTEMVKRQKDVLEVWQSLKNNARALKKITPNVLKVLGNNPNTKALKNIIKKALPLQARKDYIEKRLNLLTTSATKSLDPKFKKGLEAELKQIKEQEQAIDKQLSAVQQRFSTIAAEPIQEQALLTKKQQAKEQKNQAQFTKVQAAVQEYKRRKEIMDTIITPLKAEDLNQEKANFDKDYKNSLFNTKNMFITKKYDDLKNELANVKQNIKNLNMTEKEKEKFIDNATSLYLRKTAFIDEWAKTIT